jgi:hypothetical protein
MTKHNQFIRKAKLLIGKGDAGVDMSNLQFTFQIKQAQKSNPQHASIRIYNVSDKTAHPEYTRIVLEAGYQNGAYGTIFDGEIVQTRLGRENAVDTYMDILAAEGYSAHQAVVNTTLAAGSTALDVAEAAAKAMGLPLVNYVTTPLPRFPRGKALYGMAREILSGAAATMGASWYYLSNAIELVPLDGGKPTEATVLNAATGMIGWPEITQDGVSVRCLLNPRLDIGSPLRIDNASILRAQASTDVHFLNNYPKVDADGLYRIYVIEHRGDTRGNDWYSDIICLSIDPANSSLTGLVQKGQFA